MRLGSRAGGSSAGLVARHVWGASPGARRPSSRLPVHQGWVGWSPDRIEAAIPVLITVGLRSCRLPSRRCQQLPWEADYPRVRRGVGTKSMPRPYPVSSGSADVMPAAHLGASVLQAPVNYLPANSRQLGCPIGTGKQETVARKTLILQWKPPAASLSASSACRLMWADPQSANRTSKL